MILHYDTETTGIPVNGVPSDDPCHPHIVSLSAILDDADGVARQVISVLVKPVGYSLENFPEAQKIHGISTETADRYGFYLANVMEMFNGMAARADVLSAFNHHFDHKLLKIACARLGEDSMRAHLATKSAICTMEGAAMALSGKKRISLKNAHFELFKEESRGAHTSLGDTYASRRIYYELKARAALPEPKSLAEREYDTPYVAAAS